MRWLRNAAILAALVAPTALLALVWRGQLDTQGKLDALTAAVAERHAPPPAAPQPPAAGGVPIELSLGKQPRLAYAIEAPDILTIEAGLKDAKTGEITRLPTQAVSGQFMVRPDGTVSLGVWGSVYVTGLTTDQAMAVIRKQLTTFAEKWAADALVVTVDVQSYNSKFFYIITDDANGGEQVVRFPLTGNETVLDALANVGGLPKKTSQAKIWVARPRSNGAPNQVLPVDWAAITQHNTTATNYQLLSGDRVYIKHAAD